MSEEIRKWWEDNALDYQEERQIPIEVNYGPGTPNENSLKLLEDINGKDILEIGCGGAQCGVALAKKGANVIGIDISEEQLKYAKKLADENNVNINFLQGDITRLEKIKSNSQDVVFSSYAIMYVDDLTTCFKEVYRVLKDKGIFVFSTHHPFWGIIDKEKLKINKSYFDMRLEKEPWKKGTFFMYRPQISEIINSLANAGLIIEKVIEPGGKNYEEDFWKDNYEDFKQKAMECIPRTIIFKTRKF
jgi:ubiquinone/menaquinone biosynthesis C-methylase UbiE